MTVSVHDELTPNGNLPFDLTDPDLPGLAGYVASMSRDVNLMKSEQTRQGKLLNKIAGAMGIAIDKSEPPPPFRKELDSQREELIAAQIELEKLQKIDAETSQQIKAVTADIAEAKAGIVETKTEVAQQKVIVRSSIVEGIPKLVAVGGAIVLALTGLTALASQIWSALHGH